SGLQSDLDVRCRRVDVGDEGGPARAVVGARAAGDSERHLVRASSGHEALRGQRAVGELNLNGAERLLADDGAEPTVEASVIPRDVCDEAAAVAPPPFALGTEADGFVVRV